MYSILNKEPELERGVRQPASFLVVKRKLQKNILKFLKHFRSNRYAVKSNHLLVNIIHDMNVSADMSLFEYYQKVKGRVERVAKAHGIASALYKGKKRDKNTFYGDNVTEVIVLMDNNVSPLNAEREWQAYEPVRILRHGKNDLSLNTLNGEDVDFNGVAIIGLDIVALMLQYREWVRAQSDANVEFMGTPMQFVMQYPIANAILSHHDVAIINRLSKLYFGEPVDEMDNKQPFFLSDQTGNVDEYLLNRTTVLVSRSMKFESQLQQIELPRYTSVQPAIAFPDMAITRQNSWALVVARIPIISLLLAVDFESGGVRNRQEKSIIRKEIRKFLSDNAMQAALTPQQAEDFKTELDIKVSMYL
tara:strand:- start:2660 stop:3745 length:1086 start_codon:yes stop_codon:yes gene_type:complete